jgi:cell division protein FtsZ
MLGIKKQAEKEDVVKILIAGVGGTGCNIMRQWKEAGNPMSESCMEYVAIDTEQKALENTGSCKTVLMDEKPTEKNKEEMTELFKNADMLLLVCGMGGGTGTRVTPVIAQMAKTMGVLTVAMVTKASASEDKKRIDNAVSGIELLENSADTVFVFSADKLPANLEQNDSLEDVFLAVDEAMLRAIKGIVEPISVPGLINLDYQDVETVMKDNGKAYIGTGIGSAADGVLRAAQKAAGSLFMENTIQGADCIVIHVSGCVTLQEVKEVSDYVQEAAENQDASILVSVSEMEDSDEVFVMVIASFRQS